MPPPSSPRPRSLCPLSPPLFPFSAAGSTASGEGVGQKISRKANEVICRLPSIAVCLLATHLPNHCTAPLCMPALLASHHQPINHSIGCLQALDSVKAAMPGSHTTTTGTHTTAGTHTTHTTTGAHGTHGGVAQKAEQAFEKAKAAIPGTAEHGALHPHTAGGGVHHTTGTGHHTTTGAGTGGVSATSRPAPCFAFWLLFATGVCGNAMPGLGSVFNFRTPNMHVTFDRCIFQPVLVHSLGSLSHFAERASLSSLCRRWQV